MKSRTDRVVVDGKCLGSALGKSLGFGVALMAFTIMPDMHWHDGNVSLTKAAWAKSAGRELGRSEAGGRVGGRGHQAGRGDVRSMGSRGAGELGGMGQRQNTESAAPVATETSVDRSIEKTDPGSNHSFDGRGSQSDGLGLSRSVRVGGIKEPAAEVADAKTVDVFKPRPRSDAKVTRTSTQRQGLKSIDGLREVSTVEESQLIGKWDR